MFCHSTDHVQLACSGEKLLILTKKNEPSHVSCLIYLLTFNLVIVVNVVNSNHNHDDEWNKDFCLISMT